MTIKTPYRRILLKLSGEVLSNKIGSPQAAISHQACQNIAHSIKALRDFGMQVAIVIGGGNIFRGIQAKDLGLQRTPADQMGMLATLLNGIALQQALQALKCPTRVMSALECPDVAESYNWQRAQAYLDQNEILIFVGGTGNPYFTTDTAAALRASEIQADILFKATKVDGIYNKDPLKYPDARKYETISYSQVLAEKLEVMDATSIALCMQSKIPILVFNMQRLDAKNIEQFLTNQQQGTLVTGN